MSAKKQPSEKALARNRKASHDYFLLEKFEAGLVLRGSEIKSIRAGQVSLKEAYVRTDGREAWLVLPDQRGELDAEMRRRATAC